MVFMVERFVVACYGIVLNDNCLLMVRQGKGHWAGKWILPGGKLESGETLESCVEREIFEETCCRARAVRQLDTVSSYSPDSLFEKQVVLVFYLCQYIEGEPVRGDGVKAAAWVDEDRFTKLLFNESVPQQITNAISSVCVDTSRFPAVFFNFTEPGDETLRVK